MPTAVIETSTPIELASILEEKVVDLSKELPGISFGYIGNIESWGDNRDFRVFLPHPGRVGGLSDSVGLGNFKDLASALEAWPQIDARVRRLYANGSRTQVRRA